MMQVNIKSKKADSSVKQYPENVTLIDYFLFLATPTLVYEANFPRRASFRPLYFLGHTLMAFANIFIQYMVVTEDIVPLVKANLSAPLFELYLKLQMQLILLTILLIFLLFESMPNAISELTLYADREFYQDWWNSTSIEEFYGKWLRFSYLFFYRHVYMRVLIKYRLHPNTAKLISNLVSAFF